MDLFNLCMQTIDVKQDLDQCKVQSVDANVRAAKILHSGMDLMVCLTEIM